MEGGGGHTRWGKHTGGPLTKWFEPVSGSRRYGKIKGVTMKGKNTSR